MSEQLIRTKLSLIQKYLGKLEPLLAKDTHQIMNDELLLATVERYTQLIIDAAIDTNTHIISSRKLPTPNDYFNTFTALAEAKILEHDFARKIAGSVGLRNRIVHNYEDVSLTRMIDEIKANINDYRIYVIEILNFLKN